jgi:hypothetical protein
MKDDKLEMIIIGILSAMPWIVLIIIILKG